VPSFDVLGEFVSVVGSQVQGLVIGSDLERDYVPEVDGNQIDGENIELAEHITDTGFTDDVASVRSVALEASGFDLHAEVASVVLNANVVAGGIAMRASDAQATRRGASHKAEFGPLAALLASSDGAPVSFGSSCSTRIPLTH
jgi:hypothetical protein